LIGCALAVGAASSVAWAVFLYWLPVLTVDTFLMGYDGERLARMATLENWRLRDAGAPMERPPLYVRRGRLIRPFCIVTFEYVTQSLEGDEFVPLLHSTQCKLRTGPVSIGVVVTFAAGTVLVFSVYRVTAFVLRLMCRGSTT
jgi:hypothetical protein